MNLIFTEDYKISVDRIYKVLDADFLLAPYEAILNPIKDQPLMISLVRNFAELVQAFPDTPIGRMGGLLDKGLRRALFILNGYRTDPKFSKLYDPVWELVFFSTGLLRDVAKIMNYGIIICNQNGEYKQSWYPCSDGAMTTIKDAKYYRIIPFA